MKVEKSKKFESNKNVSSMACRITTFDTVALIFVLVVVVVVTIIFTLNTGLSEQKPLVCVITTFDTVALFLYLTLSPQNRSR